MLVWGGWRRAGRCRGSLRKGQEQRAWRARIRVLLTGDNPVCHVTPGHRSGPRCRDQGSDVGMHSGAHVPPET